MTNQEANFQYYMDNRDELNSKYPGKFLVIKDEQVVGVFDDQVTAFTETTREHEPGTFIVQQALPEAPETQIFHTRVIAAR